MSRRRNQKQKKYYVRSKSMSPQTDGEVSDYMPETKTICMPRYTYDAWMRCYPESSWDEYWEIQRPDNIMEFFARALHTWPEERLRKYKDIVVKPVLLDEDYFRWLGDGENTETTRIRYVTSERTEGNGRISKLINAELLYSNWTYAVTAMGVLNKRFMDGRVSQETTEALTEFIRTKLPKDHFDVYVIPYLLRWKQAYEDEDLLLSMTGDHFRGDTPKPQTQFETLWYQTGTAENQNRVNIFDACIPFIVRETHTSGCFTIGEIYDYLRGYGYGSKQNYRPNARNLDLLSMAEEENGSGALLSDSKAGKLLAQELSKKSGCGNGTEMVSISSRLMYRHALGDLIRKTQQDFTTSRNLRWV